MNFFLMPTLEHIASVKIATVLWRNDDLKNNLTQEILDTLNEIIEERRDDDEEDDDIIPPVPKIIQEWREKEDKIKDKVVGLILPESLKKKVLNIIKPIGLEILKWIIRHVVNQYFSLKVPDEFYWTAYGTIDKKKTAQALIKNEKIDIIKRFKIACFYCLENDMKELWQKISKNNIFYDSCDNSFRECELEDFWTYNLKGKGLKKPDRHTLARFSECTPFQYAFEYAVEYGYKEATEYFFQQLTFEEKKESLLTAAINLLTRRYDCYYEDRNKIVSKDDYCDILYFLLLHLNADGQAKIFEKYSLPVLVCFLNWPWQGLFLKAASYASCFLRVREYELVFYAMVQKVIDGYKDCNYQNLFRMLFKTIPYYPKKYFIYFDDEKHLSFPVSLLPCLLLIRDKENISLILENATHQERIQLIFSYQGKRICDVLASSNMLDMVEFFIVECARLPQHYLKLFKKSFELYLEEWDEEDYQGIFDLIDNLIQNGS